MTEKDPKVCWVWSLPRFGTSVTAYAAAAPWKYPVADEIFGPFDRTGDPYFYPAEQAGLVTEFLGDGERLTERTAACARKVFRGIAAGAPVVISKVPHPTPTLADIARHFPGHRVMLLMRNPIHRLNSYVLRGTELLDSDFELEIFKNFAREWLNHPARMLYDGLRRDPHGYFRRLFTLWGFEFTEAHVAAAVAHQRGNYHSFCKETSDGDPRRVDSESRLELPAQAVEHYLRDPFVRDLFAFVGWPADAEAYLARASA